MANDIDIDKVEMFGGKKQLDGKEHWSRLFSKDDDKSKTKKDTRKGKK